MGARKHHVIVRFSEHFSTSHSRHCARDEYTRLWHKVRDTFVTRMQQVCYDGELDFQPAEGVPSLKSHQPLETKSG